MNYTMLLVICSWIAFIIGYARGEGHEERKKYRCVGKEHKYQDTGWKGVNDRYLGRPTYHCPVCGNGFDENRVIIPKVIDELLSVRELSEMFPQYESFVIDWNQVKKYLDRY